MFLAVNNAVQRVIQTKCRQLKRLKTSQSGQELWKIIATLEHTHSHREMRSAGCRPSRTGVKQSFQLRRAHLNN